MQEFEASQQEFECIRKHAVLFTSQTEELLKHFKMSASAMYRRFDLMDLHQQHAIDSVCTLKDILLHIHHDSLSLDDYYLAINELLRGALTSLAAHFDRTDTHLIAFKSEMEGMFNHWNAMAPSPLHNGMWAAKLTNIIAQTKTDMRNAKAATETVPGSSQPNQMQAEGSGSGSKGKQVVCKKLVMTSNCQNTKPRCK
jgi:hypothetical protein